MSTAKRAGNRKRGRKTAIAESPPRPPTQLVSMRELSNHLNVGRSTLWKLVHSGQVPHYRIGSQYRFDVIAVRNAMARFS